jgi:hypothetical protein
MAASAAATNFHLQAILLRCSPVMSCQPANKRRLGMLDVSMGYVGSVFYRQVLSSGQTWLKAALNIL